MTPDRTPSPGLVPEWAAEHIPGALVAIVMMAALIYGGMVWA